MRMLEEERQVFQQLCYAQRCCIDVSRQSQVLPLEMEGLGEDLLQGSKGLGNDHLVLVPEK